MGSSLKMMRCCCSVLTQYVILSRFENNQTERQYKHQLLPLSSIIILDTNAQARHILGTVSVFVSMTCSAAFQGTHSLHVHHPTQCHFHIVYKLHCPTTRSNRWIGVPHICFVELVKLDKVWCIACTTYYPETGSFLKTMRSYAVLRVYRGTLVWYIKAVHRVFTFLLPKENEHLWNSHIAVKKTIILLDTMVHVQVCHISVVVLAYNMVWMTVKSISGYNYFHLPVLCNKQVKMERHHIFLSEAISPLRI
jgi:hypothetical protein